MKSLLKIVFNKYLIAGGAFVVWMYFFDQNNWISRMDRNNKLEEVNANIEFLNQEIATMEAKHKALTTDPAAFEKFAREQYKMKRDNEDIYIVE